MKTARILDKRDRIILFPMDVNRLQEELPVPLAGWQVHRFTGPGESPLVMIRRELHRPPGGWRLPCQQWTRFRWGRSLTHRQKGKWLPLVLVPALLLAAAGVITGLSAGHPHKADPTYAQIGLNSRDPVRPPQSQPGSSEQRPRTGRQVSLLLEDWPEGNRLTDLSVAGNEFQIRVESNDGAAFMGWITRRDGLGSLMSGPVHVNQEKGIIHPLEEFMVSGVFPVDRENCNESPGFGPPLHFWESLLIPEYSPDQVTGPPDMNTVRKLASVSGALIEGYTLPSCLDESMEIRLVGSLAELHNFLLMAAGDPLWSHVGVIRLTTGNGWGVLFMEVLQEGDIRTAGIPDWGCLGIRPARRQTVTAKTNPLPPPFYGEIPAPSREFPLLGWTLTAEGILKEVRMDPADGSIMEMIK